MKPAKNKPELLSGVGDYPCAIAAVKNGADAVYFGVKGYNMRDLGTNFTESELPKLMKYLHANKVKGYLALNTIIYDEELKSVEKILAAAKKAKVDAVIVHDLGVLFLAKKAKLPVHLSTQASVSNALAMKEYAKMGVERIVLARELNLAQISKIVKETKKAKIEVECFVHGAMCISVSGRCFLSHELFGRSANRGECLQPCRRAFFLDGASPDFEKKEVYLDGNTVMSAKDLKTISFLDKIIKAGVASLKIEGRTKPSDYVAATVKCYREAIDSVAKKTFTAEKIAEWNIELEKVYNRGFSEGHYFKIPDAEDFAEGQGSFQTQKRVHVGVVANYYAKALVAEIKLFDSVKVGDEILIEGATTFLKQSLDSMEINHKKVISAGQGQMVGIKVGERVRPNDKVFVLKERKQPQE
ncbi:Peptidase family U32 [uncultured archaeon]|nr:Peptidase family U32 [uncultured archaeon]